METAGQEVGRIETRLRQLGTRVDRLVAKASQAGAEVEVDFGKRIDEVKDKQAAVQSKLDAFRAAGGQKWDNFKDGVEMAWRDLENAYRALKH
jgi:hypothetical protein